MSDTKTTRAERDSGTVPALVGRNKFTYTVTGGGVDFDGWWKYRALRSDGKSVRLTPPRYLKLLRDGSIKSSNAN